MIGAAGKNFEATVLIRADSEQIDLPAQRGPPAPTVVGRDLPDVPQSLVGAAGESFQPAVLICSDGQQINLTSERSPRPPTASRSDLGDRPESAVVGRDEHVELP